MNTRYTQAEIDLAIKALNTVDCVEESKIFEPAPKKRFHEDEKVEAIVKATNNEFDTLWNNDKELKENIINLFSTDTNSAKPVKSTGFFNSRLMAIQREYKEMKETILNILSFETLELDKCYQVFITFIVEKAEYKEPNGEIVRKLEYATQKMLECDPTLKDLKDFSKEIKQQQGEQIPSVVFFNKLKTI